MVDACTLGLTRCMWSLRECVGMCVQSWGGGRLPDDVLHTCVTASCDVAKTVHMCVSGPKRDKGFEFCGVCACVLLSSTIVYIVSRPLVVEVREADL